MSTSFYKGKAEPLQDLDLPRIGHEIGVGEDVIHMLIEVESRGKGFDKQGRVIMLFEPHKFYKHLRGEKRSVAVEQGLAYPEWGQSKYPRDSYPRFLKACKIDETAAYKSCSWGLGQIMGENFRMVGYDDPQDMVAAFAESEKNQLEAMIEFAKSADIDDDLQVIDRKIKAGQIISPADCIPIARAWNGSGFASHNYHRRLASSANKWARIKNTKFTLDDFRKIPEEESDEALKNNPLFEEKDTPETDPVETEPGNSEEDGKVVSNPPTVIDEKPGEPKTGNPNPQDITLNKIILEDKTSKKSLWTMLYGVGAAALTWITTNIAQAIGYLKNLNDTELLKWIIIIMGVLASLYLIRQIINGVMTKWAETQYNIKAMQYHADQISNNVTLGSTPQK